MALAVTVMPLPLAWTVGPSGRRLPPFDGLAPASPAPPLGPALDGLTPLPRRRWRRAATGASSATGGEP